MKKSQSTNFRIPADIYVKVKARAKVERRSANAMGFVLIERGLASKRAA